MHKEFSSLDLDELTKILKTDLSDNEVRWECEAQLDILTTLRETWQKKLDIKTYNITYNLQNIPGTHVEVDDILSEAATMKEVLSIFRKVLVHCREKKHKTSEAQT